jgi:hypothetical protein
MLSGEGLAQINGEFPHPAFLVNWFSWDAKNPARKQG